MSSGVPGQVGSVGPNSVRPGPALLGPTDADLKVSATLPARECSADLEVGMGSGVPGQVGSVGPNSAAGAGFGSLKSAISRRDFRMFNSTHPIYAEN
jgi:hypothetical protein